MGKTNKSNKNSKNNKHDLVKNILFSLKISFYYMLSTTLFLNLVTQNTTRLLIAPMLFPIIVGCFFLILSVKEKNTKATLLSVFHIGSALLVIILNLVFKVFFYGL